MFEPHPGREMALGNVTVWRALPVRGRRMIGPWCFLDRYGPLSFTGAKPMDVAPHPHIGLQTVSWLLDGEVLHRDTLGAEAVVRAGGVNVMTSGAGIAHSEETPSPNSGRLNGVQLWVALPDAQRNIEASFHSIPEVPRHEPRGGIVYDIMAAAPSFSDIHGLDVTIHPASALALPLEPAREHGIYMLDGDADLDGQPLEPNTLYYVGTERDELPLRTSAGARLLLIGGLPFPERILMWWNFVARHPEEIAAAREAWEAGQFGEVRGYPGPRLHAPTLSRLADPNPAS